MNPSKIAKRNQLRSMNMVIKVMKMLTQRKKINNLVKTITYNLKTNNKIMGIIKMYKKLLTNL